MQYRCLCEQKINLTQTINFATTFFKCAQWARCNEYVIWNLMSGLEYRQQVLRTGGHTTFSVHACFGLSKHWAPIAPTLHWQRKRLEGFSSRIITPRLLLAKKCFGTHPIGSKAWTVNQCAIVIFLRSFYLGFTTSPERLQRQRPVFSMQMHVSQRRGVKKKQKTWWPRCWGKVPSTFSFLFPLLAFGDLKRPEIEVKWGLHQPPLCYPSQHR